MENETKQTTPEDEVIASGSKFFKLPEGASFIRVLDEGQTVYIDSKGRSASLKDEQHDKPGREHNVDAFDKKGQQIAEGTTYRPPIAIIKLLSEYRKKHGTVVGAIIRANRQGLTKEDTTYTAELPEEWELPPVLRPKTLATA